MSYGYGGQEMTEQEWEEYIHIVGGLVLGASEIIRDWNETMDELKN